MQNKVRYNPLGGLDKENDLQYVNNGDYVDAKNVIATTTDGQTSNAIEPVLGNTFAFQTTAASAQKKIVRVYITDLDDTKDVQVLAFNSNGQINIAPVVTPSTLGLGTPLDNIKQAIFDSAASSVILFYYLDGNTYLGQPDIQYVDITYLETAYIELYLQNGSSAVNTFTFDTIQEGYAIDVEENDGLLVPIGSDDKRGDAMADTFIWWALEGERQDFTVTDNLNLSANPNNEYLVTTAVAHGLTTGMIVLFVGGNSDTDGYRFQIEVTGPTLFILKGSNNTTGGVVNISGLWSYTVLYTPLGEIGWAQKSFTGVWSYIRLIRAKQLDLNVYNQVDADCQYDYQRWNLYFTDDRNAPSAMYYYGAFSTDGFIKAINPEGLYNYDDLSVQKQQTLGHPNVNITFVSQQQSGGNIGAGNHRYVVQGIGIGGARSEFSTLSNEIPTYIPNYGGSPLEIQGTAPGNRTGKSNTIQINNINTNVYEYIEVVDISYEGNAIFYTIIGRFPVTGETMQVTHTGYEAFVRDISPGEIRQINVLLEAAKNVRILENRLVLSNVRLSEVYDLTEWATDIQLSSVVYNAPTTGILDNVGNFTDTVLNAQRQGEYQNPEAVFNYTTYMDYDTYAFAALVKFKDGSEMTYPIGTLLIQPLDAGNYDPSFWYSSINPAAVRPRAIQADNIQIDYEVTPGVRIRDIVDSIEIVRADHIPEVLACGMLINSLENPAALGIYFPIVNVITSTATAYPGGYGAYNIVDDVLLFYSPDLLYGNTSITYKPGDQLIMYSWSQAYLNAGQWGVGNGAFGSVTSLIFEFEGQLSYTAAYNVANNFASVDALYQSGRGSQVNISGGNVYSKTWGAPPDLVELESCPVIEITRPGGANSGTSTNYGFEHALYYRDLGGAAKFGDLQNVKWNPTGHFLKVDITTAAIVNGEQVFGGDCFINKHYLHLGIRRTQAATTYGQGLGYYCISRTNANLIHQPGNSNDYVFPASIANAAAADKLGYWLNTPIQSLNYNFGYNIRNDVKDYVSYLQDVPYITDLPVRIYYSQSKPQNSLVDSFREILPLNFRDLDVTQGEIVHHESFDGELFTFQPRRMQRQFFDTTGQLQTSSGAEIIIGDGSVLSRNGVTITQFGADNKWSIIRARSVGGGDVLYWINTEYKVVCRFGSDGVVILSDRANMRSFFLNNLMFVNGVDTPAAGLGICGVWDDVHKKAIWTIRGVNNIVEWEALVNYNEGDAVYYGNTNDYGVNKAIYIALVNNPAGPPSSGGTTSPDWRLLDRNSDEARQYFNEYTIDFDEYRNKFFTYYSFTPRIYIKHANYILTGNSKSEYLNRVYEHYIGSYCCWYETTTIVNVTRNGTNTVTGTGFLETFASFQYIEYYLVIASVEYRVVNVPNDNTAVLDNVVPGAGIVNAQLITRLCEDGYLESVLNIEPNINKRFLATQYTTEIAPYRIELTTPDHSSFLLETDFEEIEDYFWCAYKNDTTVTALNPSGSREGDGSWLWGRWLKSKLYFEKETYQKFYNHIVSLVLQSRKAK